MAPSVAEICPPDHVETVRHLVREGIARRETYDGVGYVRVADDAAGLARGTVFVGKRHVPAYPPVARIFSLAEGLRRSFPGSFYAEEKLDGYNVRIVRVGDRNLPFTRGGFLCPFTLDRLPDLVEPTPLFEKYPDLVVCGEVVGPDNPYLESTSPRVASDVAFFAFDLMELDTGKFVPVEERNRILDEFSIPRAPFFGRFDVRESQRLRKLVLDLDAEGAEGLVFKPPAEGLRVKYVTPEINVDDIVVDGPLLTELPAEFFVGRLVRLVISLEELGLADRIERVERRVGRALVSGFLETVRAVLRDGKATRTYRVRLRSERAADALVAHLDRASLKIQAREVERRREGEWIHLVVEKTFLRSTSVLRNLLAGHHVLD